MSTIVVRRMRFTYPDELDPVFVTDDPEFSFVAFSLSVLLPHLEPYLIRTMKAAEPHVRDPQLLRDLHAFVLQEGQHYQQHKRFNERLLAGRTHDRLAALEAELIADYERFSAEAPLSFNLAYAEGFEALTTSIAIRFLKLDRSSWDPSVLELFEWHLIEEVEHRCVAFDVYNHVVGSWANRVRVGTYAQWHLLRFMLRGTKALLDDSAVRLEQLGGRRAHRRRALRLFFRLFAPLFPRIASTHLPWYSPRRVPIPSSYAALAARYTERAERSLPATS